MHTRSIKITPFGLTIMLFGIFLRIGMQDRLFGLELPILLFAPAVGFVGRIPRQERMMIKYLTLLLNLALPFLLCACRVDVRAERQMPAPSTFTPPSIASPAPTDTLAFRSTAPLTPASVPTPARTSTPVSTARTPQRTSTTAPPTLPARVTSPGQGGTAETVVAEFLHAVSARDLQKAMGYWRFNCIEQPAGYESQMRGLVSAWIAGSHHFRIVKSTYSGFFMPGDYRELPENDPRVQHASVTVRGGDFEVFLRLDKENNQWWITGVAEPGAASPAGAEALYLKDD